MISSPALLVPRVLGSDSKRSASSYVTVSNVIVERRDAVFAFGASAFFFFFLPDAVSSTGTSGNTSVMYGPKRPLFAIIGKLVAGSIPSSRSPEGAANNSIAFASVNSSGAKFSGIFASLRSSPSLFSCRYAP